MGAETNGLEMFFNRDGWLADGRRRFSWKGEEETIGRWRWLEREMNIKRSALKRDETLLHGWPVEDVAWHCSTSTEWIFEFQIFERPSEPEPVDIVTTALVTSIEVVWLSFSSSSSSFYPLFLFPFFFLFWLGLVLIKKLSVTSLTYMDNTCNWCVFVMKVTFYVRLVSSSEGEFVLIFFRYCCCLFFSFCLLLSLWILI